MISVLSPPRGTACNPQDVCVVNEGSCIHHSWCCVHPGCAIVGLWEMYSTIGICGIALYSREYQGYTHPPRGATVAMHYPLDGLMGLCTAPQRGCILEGLHAVQFPIGAARTEHSSPVELPGVHLKGTTCSSPEKLPFRMTMCSDLEHLQRMDTGTHQSSRGFTLDTACSKMKGCWDYTHLSID